MFGSRSSLLDFLGSDFFRMGDDATPVAADTDDVVDASFGEPAPQVRVRRAVAAVGWPAASANSRNLVQEAAKHACRFGGSEVDPNICCWLWPTATWWTGPGSVQDQGR
ncbi:hypothetical protein ACVXHA_21495 [Escherichia coli]